MNDDYMSARTFPVFVGELKGLDQAQGFVHRAPHGQVVDRDLAQVTLVIDDEQTSTEKNIN